MSHVFLKFPTTDAENSTMSCPACSHRHLVEIELTLKERRVTLHSCSRCETKWWDQDGERVAVARVLDLARK